LFGQTKREQKGAKCEMISLGIHFLGLSRCPAGDFQVFSPTW
jgi:hypothetical protein